MSRPTSTVKVLQSSAGLLVFIAAIVLPAQALGGSSSAREQFLEQYQPHAEALERAYTNIKMKWTITISSSNGVVQISSVETKYNRSNMLFRSISGKQFVQATGKILSESSGGNIEGQNDRYAFDLRSKPENQYVVRSVEMHTPNQRPFLCYVTVPFADPHSVRQTYLEMARDDANQILAFEDCQWQDQPMKELQVRYSATNMSTKKPMGVTGGFYFSPAERWICRGKWFVLDVEPNIVYEDRYDYEPRPGEEFPALKRIEEIEKDQKKKTSRRANVMEITEFERCPPFADADFRLTAFGLPEPQGVQWPTPPKTWLWLVLAGVVVGLLAGLFTWLKRRHTRTVPI